MINEEDKPKRGRPKKNADKKESKPKAKRKVEMTEEEEELVARSKFCKKVRDVLDIDYRDNTIADSLTADDEFISGQWKKIGRIVMPFVAGGVAMEGPQSTVKNAFVIGYYLGSLKSKHTKEIEAFNKTFGILSE